MQNHHKRTLDSPEELVEQIEALDFIENKKAIQSGQSPLQLDQNTTTFVLEYLSLLFFSRYSYFVFNFIFFSWQKLIVPAKRGENCDHRSDMFPFICIGCSKY